MKKALEVLKEYKTIDFGCDMSELYFRIDEAIEELESLCGSKQLVDNQTCENCKHFSCGFKFGEFCCLVSNGNECKWESK